jgi:cytochrome c peroxidase
MKSTHNNRHSTLPAAAAFALIGFLAPRAAAADQVPKGLVPPPVPADNPMSAAKIALGEKLFFDPRLSADRSVSCGSCHNPGHAFADTGALSKGVGQQSGERNAPTLLNVAYLPRLLFDGRSFSLEDQVRYPLTHPREMSNTTENVVKLLAADAEYPPLFRQAFGDDRIVWDRVAKAVAAFERTLLSGNSPFDRYVAGSQKAIPNAAKRGFDLFKGKAGCINCHRYSPESPFFTDFDFHNTGVGWAGSPDLGRYEITKAPEDKGAFKTPSLRNVALTAPYMHDGKTATLHDVVNYYSRGAEPNRYLDSKIRPLNLTDAEKEDLVAFLESLTGEQTFQAAPRPAATPAAGNVKRDSRPLPPTVAAPFDDVEVIAGNGDFGDGGKAMDALFIGVGGVAADFGGNVYIADSGGERVRRIDARTGIISTVAGTGLLTGADEGAAAIEQPLRGPAPLAIDDTGRYLFVGEVVGRRVKRIDLRTGEMRDVGAPRGGFAKPSGLAWNPSALLVADSGRGQIWALTPDGWTAVLPADRLVRGGLRSIAVDAEGRIYMSEYFAHRVLRWDPEAQRLEVVAGTGEAGRLADGALAPQSPLHTPDGIALDARGDIFIADKGNHRICHLDMKTGRLETVADAANSDNAERWTPGPLATGGNRTLWVGDIHRNRLMRWLPGSPLIAIAGDGDIHDGGPAVEARLAHPGGVTADLEGNIYISDTLHHRVRVIDAKSGNIRTVAGNGLPGFNEDHAPATSASLSYPAKLQIDGRGRLYIGDYYNNRVRLVDLRGEIISTVAGNGGAGEDGDGRSAEEATLLNPHALLLKSNSLYIASAVSPKLRYLDLSSSRIQSVPMPPLPEEQVFYGLTWWKGGLVLASPRPGSIEFLKEGALSRLFDRAQVDFPQDVAISADDDLYIADTGKNRILRWNGTNLDVVVEGLGRPRSIAFTSHGDLLIADTFHNRVLRVFKRAN